MGMFGDGNGNGRTRVPSASGAMALAGEVADGMDAQTALLHSVLEALDTNVEQVAITDEAQDPVLQKDFPVEGISRWIIHRIAVGGRFDITTTLSDVLASNPNRFGGTIVNSGSKAVVLYMSNARTGAAQGGISQVWLGPNGGSWDFRFGNMIWCGAISAVVEVEEGESTLRVVEV